MRPLPAPVHVLAAAVVAAITLSACGGGSSTDVLEENLAAQTQALEALRSRVGDLSDRVDLVGAEDGTGLGEVADQLEDLLARLAELEATVADRLASDEDATSTVAVRLGQFQEQLDEVVASVRQLTSLVTDVQTGLDRLRADLEEHVEDPFAHQR
jgi:ABC-type transporter Mla subunit MlaD